MSALADTFEEHRGLLFAIAYRMTGAAADSEDLVQEAYIRWQAVDGESVDSPKAYLSTIITRLALDYMKSARVRRESYVGPWLPEPVAGSAAPHDAADMADSVTVAFMLLLERLNPVERAAYLLREIFDFNYDEIARILDKSETNCRQYVRRAKQHLKENRPRFDTPPDRQQDLIERFIVACASADADGLIAMLSEDAILYSDGGGKVLAARNPIYGADRVVRFLIGVTQKAHDAERTVSITELNGQLGCIVMADGEAENVFLFDCDEASIHRIYAVRNPDKLSQIPRV